MDKNEYTFGQFLRKAWWFFIIAFGHSFRNAQKVGLTNSVIGDIAISIGIIFVILYLYWFLKYSNDNKFNNIKTENMEKFLTKYQTMIGIVLGSIIIGSFIYMGNQQNNDDGLLEKSQKTTENITLEQKESDNDSNIKTQTETVTDTSEKMKPEPTWKTVTYFEGVGMKKTPPFTIQGNKWRIKWSCYTEEGQYGLSVSAQPIKGGETSSEIVQTTCPFSGTNEYEPIFGNRGPGNYYLDILADQYIKTQPGWGTSWKITVEELY